MSITPKTTYTTVTLPAGYYDAFEYWITPRLDPASDSYFWALRFSFGGGAYGYLGMQNFATNVGGAGIHGKGVVFGIDSGAFGGSSAGLVESSFIGGIPGVTVKRAYSWTVDTIYKLTVARGATAVDGFVWEASVTNLTTSSVTPIGSIKVPFSWGGLYQPRYSTERLSGSLSACGDIQHSKVDFRVFRANGLPPTTYVNSYDPVSTCDTSLITNLSDGIRHEMGMSTPASAPPHTASSGPRKHPALVWMFGIDDVQIGPLHDLDDVYHEEKLQGTEELIFSMRRDDPKRNWVDGDRKVVYEGRAYRVYDLQDIREGTGIYTVVKATALWNDLTDEIRFGNYSVVGKTPAEGLADILEHSNWAVGRVPEISTLYSIDTKNPTTLSLLRTWAQVVGLELVFDTLNRTVSMSVEEGTVRGTGFRYARNLLSVKKQYTPPQVTRLWPVGANDMLISGVSIDSLPYIEDFSWYTSQGMTEDEARASYLKEAIWEDTRFIEALPLYDAAVAKLATLSQPLISYECSVMDLSQLTGIPEDEFYIGDRVDVEDTELGIQITTRVVRLIHYRNEPWNNQVELSFYRPGLNIEALLDGRTSGAGGTEWKMFVSENSSGTIISSSTQTVDQVSFTISGLSNGIVGAHFFATATGTGTLELKVTLDGEAIGVPITKPFTNGEKVEVGIPTWYASLGEGSHTVAVTARVSSGSGTLALAPVAARLYAFVSGALGGGGTGGPTAVTVGDVVPSEDGLPVETSPTISLIADVARTTAEVPDPEDEEPVEVTSPPTIVIT